jgi:hypothetical protein
LRIMSRMDYCDLKEGDLHNPHEKMKKFINSTINFIDQINWHEVGQAIVKTVAFTYTLGYCLGLWVHRTNAQLSAAHVAALGLKPTATVEEPTAVEPAPQQPQPMAQVQAPVEIAQLSTRQLMQLVGTKRKISKKQLLAMYAQVA